MRLPQNPEEKSLTVRVILLLRIGKSPFRVTNQIYQFPTPVISYQSIISKTLPAPVSIVAINAHTNTSKKIENITHV